MDDEAIINYWADYQAAEHCSTDTIKERRIVVYALLRRSGKTLLTLTRHDLIRDLGRPLAAKTKQNYRSLFHTLFTWIQDEGFRLDNPAARLPRTRVPSTEANPLETEDIEYLLASGIYGKTRMYVLLYSYQGFRAVEIAAVAGETIDWTHQRILSKEGKGGKEVWRPIHPIVWDELQKYPRSGPLFPSPKGGHVSRKNVSNVLSKALKRAGITTHVPHNLRAWHATELIDAGVPMIVVQHSMRHSDLQSMGAYVRIRERLLRDAIDKLPTVEVPQTSGRRAA